MRQDLVDETVGKGFVRVHKIVAVRVSGYGFDRLSRHIREHSVNPFAGPCKIVCVNFDVGALALTSLQQLMDHDLAGGQRVALPFSPAASSSAPIEAAIPTQSVETSQLT